MDRKEQPIRDLLFICHANPVDNDFSTWLGSRLSSMGFKVWADFQDLKGGSKHWNVIEDKIRQEAIKVLVVTSKASRDAEGVDNEINIAKGIEKELNLKDFIIQLKIDDLPYAQLPPVLNNRLVIPFQNNWGEGLQLLVEQLHEDNVPIYSINPSALDLFSSVLKDKSDKLVDINEPAFSSWLPLETPKRLYVYTFPFTAKTMEERIVSEGIPAYSFSNTLITFAVPDTLSYAGALSINELQCVDTSVESWINDHSESDFAIQRRDRRRVFNGLLNSSWEIGMQNRGFVGYQLANERAYFIPSEDKEEIKQHYTDPLDRITRPVKLVGESPKYSALYHAAISSRASLSPIPMYSIRLHVAFTDDGLTPIADGEKAFRMRRTFCKSFWNDRWRRILFALFSRLSNEEDNFILNTGGNESIKVRFPIDFNLPYSIESDVATNVDETLIEEDINTEDFEIDDIYLDEAEENE